MAAVNQNRVDAKQVIMAACNLFASMNLGLTDADSPAVIDQKDARFAEFFEKLVDYRSVKGIEVADIRFECSIVAVEAATARGSETNYRFTVVKASMVVNGANASYVKGEGLVCE